MDDIEKDYEIEISKEAKKELELIKKISNFCCEK